MGDYTYLLGDLRTGGIAGELPLGEVKFSRRLKDAGSWSASLPLGDARVRSLDPIGLTRPGRTALYIDRDGVIVGGGILWTRRFQTNGDDAGKLQLAGSGFWSYWQHRKIRSTLTFEGVDQAAIVEAIFDALQAVTAGSIGMNIDAPGTGVLRDRTYYGYERKGAAEAVEQLSDVIDGFDFELAAAWDGNTPVLTLQVAYPRIGVQAIDSPLVFDRPGNILDYDCPEDATRMADLSDAVGAGEGDDMLVATSTATAVLDAGWPLLEQVVSYKDVRITDTLAEHADADLEAAATPVTIPSMTVRGDADPVVGSYRPGDDCRIVITDDRFPAGLDTYARIVGFEVQPPTGEDPETVTVDLGEVTIDDS